jgi:predicted nucleotidyltransferase
MIIPDMGTKRTAKSRPLATRGLSDVLFTPVQQRILGLLFGQPERRFQSAELIRLAGSGTGAAHRLLTRLAETGLVTTERVGNQKHYQANPASPVYAELSGLMRKTVGLAAPLHAALAPLEPKIAAAFIYGSIAKGADKATSDIDLMVIGRDRKAGALEYGTLYGALQVAETALGRQINPNLMTHVEWRRKRAEAGSFAARIATQPHLFVIGSDRELA